MSKGKWKQGNKTKYAYTGSGSVYEVFATNKKDAATKLNDLLPNLGVTPKDMYKVRSDFPHTDTNGTR